MGTVGIGSFLNQRDIYKEAVKSSMRNARGQIDNAPPALGLLLFDFPLDQFEENDILDMLECAISVAPSAPIIGIPTKSQFSRCLNRSVMSQKESVISVLVPQ